MEMFTFSMVGAVAVLFGILIYLVIEDENHKGGFK